MTEGKNKRDEETSELMKKYRVEKRCRAPPRRCDRQNKTVHQHDKQSTTKSERKGEENRNTTKALVLISKKITFRYDKLKKTSITITITIINAIVSKHQNFDKRYDNVTINKAINDAQSPQSPPAHVGIFCCRAINTRPRIVRPSSLNVSTTSCYVGPVALRRTRRRVRPCYHTTAVYTAMGTMLSYL